MHLKSEKIMLMWKIEVVLLKVSYTTHKNLVNLTNIYTIDGCALHIVPSQLWQSQYIYCCLYGTKHYVFPECSLVKEDFISFLCKHLYVSESFVPAPTLNWISNFLTN